MSSEKKNKLGSSLSALLVLEVFVAPGLLFSSTLSSSTPLMQKTNPVMKFAVLNDAVWPDSLRSSHRGGSEKALELEVEFKELNP